MDRTVFGIFVFKFEARLAIDKLLDKGFTDDQVDIWFAPSKEFAETVLNSDSHVNTVKQAERFFTKLMGTKEEASYFTNLAVKHAAVVSVHAATPKAARVASEILDEAGALKS